MSFPPSHLSTSKPLLTQNSPDEAGFCLSLLTLTIAVVRAYTHRLSYLPRLASIFYDYLLLVLWFVVGVALLLNLDCPSMKVGLFGYVAVSQSIYVLPMFYTVRAGISIMRLSLDRIIGCTPEDIEPGYYGRVALDDGEDKDVYVLSRFV